MPTIRAVPRSSERTQEQIREHYELEKQLASRLRNASREERRHLYNELYDELHRRLPHHPMVMRKADRAAQQRLLKRQMRLLRHFLAPEMVFLEIGAGDCSLSFAVAAQVRHVYAVDVSAEIAHAMTQPQNFELIISDGCSIPVPDASIDFAYSNQVMEHLHPDDAAEQLQHIYRALKPGGTYLCMTPNPLSGPHDVSSSFDQVATGFHLKEYTTSELARLFRADGFSRVQAFSEIGSRLLLLPIALVSAVELGLSRLPYRVHQPLADHLPLRKLLGKVVATK